MSLFKVRKAVFMKIIIVWDVTSYSPVEAFLFRMEDEAKQAARCLRLAGFLILLLEPKGG
jgi:hypothetical protein